MSEPKHGVLTEEQWQRVTDVIRLLEDVLGDGYPFAVVIGPHFEDKNPDCAVSSCSNLDGDSLMVLLEEARKAVPSATIEPVEKPS